MKRIMPLLAVALLAAPAAAAERSYPVTDFDRIQVEGPFQVILATGQSSHVRATGPADALDRVSVEVEGGLLRIRANASAWGTASQSQGPVRIEASTRDLARATVLGSGDLVIDKARGLRVDLAVGGSGQLSVGAVDADNLVVDLLGSGEIKVGGRAKQLHIAAKGSGNVIGAGLTADDVQLAADTAGNVTLGGARSVKIVATGSGDVTVGGTPACTVDNKGSGRVRCGS
jgi:hypothetical protein